MSDFETELTRDEQLAKMRSPSLKFDETTLAEQGEHTSGFRAFTSGLPKDKTKSASWQKGWGDAERFLPEHQRPYNQRGVK